MFTVNMLTLAAHIHLLQKNCWSMNRTALLKLRLDKYVARGEKINLSQIKDRQSCKNECLKDFFEFFYTKCAESHENKVDVLFFMLRNELWNNGERNKANEIQNIWINKSETCVDQSLAMRVDLLMTKSQYRKQYGLFEQQLANNVLKPPSQLDETEKCYLPGSIEFQITDLNGTILHHYKPNFGFMTQITDIVVF